MRSSTIFSAVVVSSSAVLGQNDRAPFDATQIQLDAWSRMDHLIDIDHDGDLDALGGWIIESSASTFHIEAYINDGHGDFASDTWLIGIENTNQWSTHFAVGDFTGDGHDDFVVGHHDEVILFQTSPGATPTELSRQSAFMPTRQIVPLDANGDGLEDIAIRFGTGQVNLLLSTGSGFSYVGTWNGAAVNLAAIEADGDANDELLVQHAGTLECVDLQSGQLTLLASYTLASWHTLTTTGDIDGDGDEDIVVFANSGGNNYNVIRRDGPSSFTVEPYSFGGPATGLADVDGDGDLDGVCCGGGVSPSSNDGGSMFEVSINDGTGAFAHAWPLKNIGARQLAGAADIDGDGDCDLVAGRGVFFNRGSFERQPASYLNITPSRWMRIGDIDSDGDPDLDLAWFDIARNHGDGTTNRESLWLASAPPNHWFAPPGYPGDFDGDGDIDVVTGLSDPSGFVAMALLRNQGGGSFEYGGHAGPAGVAFHPAVGGEFAITGGQGHAAIRDFDGDGDTDIASVYLNTVQGSVRSQVWTNDGTATFSGGSLIQDYVVIDAADFDGDGQMELFASTAAGQRRILDSDGNGGWIALPFSVDSHFDAVWAIEDVDADGDVDLVGANDRWPLLLLNNGDATFVQTAPIGTENVLDTFVSRHFALDVNADGRIDIVAYPGESGGSLLLLQDAAGDFDVSHQMIEPHAFADLDGDDDLDSIGTRLDRSALNTPFSHGTRVQYGNSVAGQDGVAPTIGEIGPFHVGATPVSKVVGGLGGALAAYNFGLVQSELVNVPFPGHTYYAWPVLASVPVTLDGNAGETGTGSLTLPYLVPAGFAGWTLYKQVWILDPAAPYSFSHTGGIAITFGN